jgi:hypothetical protein
MGYFVTCNQSGVRTWVRFEIRFFLSRVAWDSSTGLVVLGWCFGVGHGDGVLLCCCRARCVVVVVVVVVVAVFSSSAAEVSHDACCDEDPFDGKFRKLFIDQESTGKLRGRRKQLWMQGM